MRSRCLLGTCFFLLLVRGAAWAGAEPPRPPSADTRQQRQEQTDVPYQPAAPTRELRLGLVCYGGVSLAIYMHGITSELHKLVRASNAHSNGGGPNPFLDNTTEHVYFEILRQIAAKQPLRVIVDVIAGTSAGGINGVALAKALAHDLDQAPLKQVWFDKASIRKLLSPWKLLKGEAVCIFDMENEHLETIVPR